MSRLTTCRDVCFTCLFYMIHCSVQYLLYSREHSNDYDRYSLSVERRLRVAVSMSVTCWNCWFARLECRAHIVVVFFKFVVWRLWPKCQAGEDSKMRSKFKGRMA